jgi:hypothetical protein
MRGDAWHLHPWRMAMATIRRFIITAALAFGLVALWAATRPPATRQVSTSPSSPMTDALFLCRTQKGIDQICAAALTKALIIEQRKHDATAATDRACHADPRKFGKTWNSSISEYQGWKRQAGTLWMERDGLRLVIHLPLAKGYVRFAVIDHRGPNHHPDRLIGSGTLDDVETAKDAAERMAERLVTASVESDPMQTTN